MNLTYLFAVCGAMTLASCSSTAQDNVYRSKNNEAGAFFSTDGLTAPEHNAAVMTGEAGFLYDLSNRFAKEVLSTVNFAFGSAQLDAGAQDTLNEQATWISQFPEVRLKVYGHTDAVGSSGANKQLGLRRAQAVVAYLASRGISQSRLEAVVTLGEKQPLIVSQGRERRNRRTVTEVTGFLNDHPTIIDGKYAEVVFRDFTASGASPSTLSTIQGSSGISSGASQ